MTQNNFQNHQRSRLSIILFPKNVLNNTFRLRLFLHLFLLCSPLYIKYQRELHLLPHSVISLLKKIPDENKFNQIEISSIFNNIKSKRKFTQYPFLSALTIPLKTLQSQEKYSDWLALTLLCCIQLTILGQHTSAIKAALREIRLIATHPRHVNLLNELPEVRSFSSLSDLSGALRNMRTSFIGSHIESHGLNFIFTVLHDAVRLSKGIIRPRLFQTKLLNQTPTKTPEESLSVETIFESDEPELEEDNEENNLDNASKAPPFKRKTERLYLKNNKEKKDENGRSKDIEAIKSYRHYDSRQRNKSIALKAAQGKEVANKISRRHLSLKCDIEHLTDWDITHLIKYCIKNSDHNRVANWLLLSLLIGRHPQWIKEKAEKNTCFEFKNNQVYYLLFHQVPASHQAEKIQPLLPFVTDKIALPIPSYLNKWIDSKGVHTLPSKEEFNHVLKEINQASTTRLSLWRICRYLEHWFINQGIDDVITALLQNKNHKEKPALSYSCIEVNSVLMSHEKYLIAIFAQANLFLDPPTLPKEKDRTGSRLSLPKHVLHHLFEVLKAPLLNPTTIWEFHNLFVVYVWALLSFCTGHRDVTAPMGKLSDYNFSQGTWWISDKECRHGLAARTVIIPDTAKKQITLYLEHLNVLMKQSRFIEPSIEKRCELAMNGSGNLLFTLANKNEKWTPFDLTPTLLHQFLGSRLPLPHNWGRHHVRSELMLQKINSEIINGWMGHEEFGEEAFGKYSLMSLRQLRQVSEAIESILHTHEIKAVSGWKTR